MWVILARLARRFAEWADPVPVVVPTAVADVPAVSGTDLASAARALIYELVRMPRRAEYKRAVARVRLRKLFPNVPDHVLNLSIETAVSQWHEKRRRTQW